MPVYQEWKLHSVNNIGVACCSKFKIPALFRLAKVLKNCPRWPSTNRKVVCGDKFKLQFREDGVIFGLI